MARPATITYDSFFRKAEAVQEIYGRVTYERMREVLGSGSMSTYKPLMERWRRERREKTSMGVPKALSQRIDIVVREVYSQIADLAEQDKTAAIEGAESRVAESELALRHKEEALIDLKERLRVAERRVDLLESELREALHANAELSRSFSELARR